MNLSADPDVRKGYDYFDRDDLSHEEENNWFQLALEDVKGTVAAETTLEGDVTVDGLDKEKKSSFHIAFSWRI